MTSFMGVSHGITIKKLEDYVQSIQHLKYHSLLIFIHSIDIYVPALFTLYIYFSKDNKKNLRSLLPFCAPPFITIVLSLDN